MFDIHKVKPVHGWREFIGEVGIIVLGVLIALGAEQVVENFHYRHEMRDAREALKVEIQSNLWSVDDRLKLSSCIAKRLDDLDLWAKSQSSDQPLSLARPISSPTIQVTGTSVWRVATSEVVGKMPFQERVDYAQIYDTLATIDGITTRGAEVWRDLAMVGDGQVLDPRQIYKARLYIRQLKGMNELQASDDKVLLDEGAKMGLSPHNKAAYVPELLGRQRSYCARIINTGIVKPHRT